MKNILIISIIFWGLLLWGCVKQENQKNIATQKNKDISQLQQNALEKKQEITTNPTNGEIKLWLEKYLTSLKGNNVSIVDVVITETNWVMAYWNANETNGETKDGWLWLAIKNKENNFWEIIFTWKGEVIKNCEEISKKYSYFDENFISKAGLSCKK